jgi:hypothetical protein
MRNGSWIVVVEIRWCINDESAELIDAAILGVSALPNKLPRSPIAASILVTNQITRVLNLLLSKCHRPFKLIYDRFLWSLASLSFNDRPLNNFYECRTRSGQFTTL